MLELGVPVGVEMTFWKCKEKLHAESIWSPTQVTHLVAYHLPHLGPSGDSRDKGK